MAEPIGIHPHRAVKALAAALLALPALGAAQEPPAPRSLTVTGEAELRTVPDRAQLQLAVDALDLDLKAAEAKVNRIVRDALAEIRKLGVAERKVSTTGISIQPEYVWDDQARRQVLNGYRVRRDIAVALDDLGRLADLILAATRAGVNQVHSPALESSRADELRRQVLVAATRDARAKAALLAETLGMKLGPALNVNAGQGYVPPPQPVLYKAMRAEAADAAQELGLALGEIRYTANVTASFELLP